VLLILPGQAVTAPLVVDTKGNGFKFTTAKAGVWFDIDADGVRELVGWTQKSSDDAWLAMDRNENGVIDNGSELFGDVTPGDRSHPTSPNGFEALRFLDTNPDGIIDAKDAAFARLLLWTDRNHDGISTPDELVPVNASPLRSIDLHYTVVSRVRHANTIRQPSFVSWADGTRSIVDIWLDTIEP
jgi:hypothetical protein